MHKTECLRLFKPRKTKASATIQITLCISVAKQDLELDILIWTVKKYSRLKVDRHIFRRKVRWMQSFAIIASGLPGSHTFLTI